MHEIILIRFLLILLCVVVVLAAFKAFQMLRRSSSGPQEDSRDAGFLASGAGPASPASDPRGVTPEVVVVIAAAVAETVGAKARIHHIRMIRGADPGGWAHVGRLDIMRSRATSKPRS